MSAHPEPTMDHGQSMRVVILAGGRGTRISEETDVKPKPMADIGGRPNLWHIMRHDAAQGFDDIVIAGGYKADVIEPFFLDEVTLRELRLLQGPWDSGMAPWTSWTDDPVRALAAA